MGPIRSARHYFLDYALESDAIFVHYGWSPQAEKDITKLYNSMDFTAEEAKAATPVSACGTTLSVTPTVRTVVSFCVSNFINYLKGVTIKNMIMIDAFAMNIVCFPE
jgi:hypothetical protein